MPHELTIPEDQRWFTPLPKDEPFFSRQALIKNIACPIAAYLAWAVIYYILVFCVCSRKIKNKGYVTLFQCFGEFEWCDKIFKKVGPRWSPFVFLGYHFMFFLVTLVFALFTFYFEYL